MFSQEFTNAAANAAGNEYAGTRGALANARPTFSGTLSCRAVTYGHTITCANGSTFSGTLCCRAVAYGHTITRANGPTFSGALCCRACAYGHTITRANGPTFSGTNGAA